MDHPRLETFRLATITLTVRHSSLPCVCVHTVKRSSPVSSEKLTSKFMTLIYIILYHTYLKMATAIASMGACDPH